jgi:hypothetical protein
VDSDIRTSGSARARGRGPIAPQARARLSPPTCSRSPSRPPLHHRHDATAGNPDASRSFAGCDSGGHARHGTRARGDPLGSADRRPVALGTAPPAHRNPRSRSGRDHSSCRSTPEPGSARTRTAAPMHPTARLHPHMDDVRKEWNSAPAYVLGTVWGTTSIRTWRFRSASCLPIRQLITTPLCGSMRCRDPTARKRLWICGQRKRVAHIPQAASNSRQLQCDDWRKAAPTCGCTQPAIRAPPAATAAQTIAPSLRGF